MKLLDQRAKILKRKKVEYYLGKASPDIYKDKPFNLTLVKSDLPIYVDSDDEMCDLELKMSYQQGIVTYLESIIKEINNRNWTIRNAIEWRKFTNGIV